MSQKPIVAIDCDDVLFPFISNFIEYNTRHHETYVPIEHFNTFRLHDVYNLSLDEASRRVEQFLLNADIEQFQPLPGAQETVSCLKEKYNLVVVTARLSTLERVTIQYLDRYFPDAFSGIYLGNHFGEGTTRSKIEICREVNAKILIDDQPGYVLECYSNGMGAIIFGEYQWNKGLEKEHHSLNRARTWHEVPPLVNALSSS